MVVINQRGNLNSGENNSPEISINSNLKDGFLEILACGNQIGRIFLMMDKKLITYV